MIFALEINNREFIARQSSSSVILKLPLSESGRAKSTTHLDGFEVVRGMGRARYGLTALNLGMVDKEGIHNPSYVQKKSLKSKYEIQFWIQYDTIE